jgi:two-component system sensor histidine kinase KdpD
VAVATGLVAELARTRGREAEQRRQEADLAAEIAQLLLGAEHFEEALEVAAQRLASAIGVVSASISLQDVEANDGWLVFALQSAGTRIGTLLLPGTLASADSVRVTDRVVPSLESILVAALNRAKLQTEVVETTALRRSDELKTAVLRSVSHDLRTPLTAILMAATALDPERPTSENVGEVREQVIEAATRLWRLVEKLLDLSVLQAGRAEPRLAWYSMDEVLHEAIEQMDRKSVVFKLSIEPEIPLLWGDPGQLERAFANVLENAARYSLETPVSVRARTVGGRIRVLIVDQGPGIPHKEQQHIFLPFYRAPGVQPHHSGSGLGLAITRGFIELNGGRIDVESLPGQGTSFVVEFPLVTHEDGAMAASVGSQDSGG